MDTFRNTFRLYGIGLLLVLMLSIISACATDIQTERTKLPYIDDKAGTSGNAGAGASDKTDERANGADK